MQIAKVEVVYTNGGKPYTFSANDLQLKKGDAVVVDTVRGNELGYINSEISFIDEDELSEPLKKVLRVATPQDLQTKQENNKKEIKS